MRSLSNDLRTVAEEAYVYFYPLLTMEVTRLQLTMDDPDGVRAVGGPANEFRHLRQYPSAEFRSVVRPNFDTLYSSAFLDLTGGPVVITVPDAGDRYYMLPMLDMWTDVFANPGTRTSGNGPQRLAVVPPGHRGDVPDGSDRIEAPTPYVWVIGRVQTNGPADYEAVNRFQDGLGIEAVGGPTVSPAATVAGVTPATEPLAFVNALSATDFLAAAARLLAVNPPHLTDYSQLARLRSLGLRPGQPWDASQFSETELATVQEGAAAGLAAIKAAVAQIGSHVNGWIVLADTMGVYGNYYLKRALVTLVGLGANPAEDAVYPLLLADGDGDPLSGEGDYVIHFDADRLPPADAFWSVTMYDAEGFQVGNELDRFAIGDRDPIRYNQDGSLDLYLQHRNPGPDQEANWLPAPTGALGVTMRLYAPRPEVLNGGWVPPVVRKA